jgi:ABC-type transport system involved in multi-copper enzyme maturation permease subunit
MKKLLYEARLVCSFSSLLPCFGVFVYSILNRLLSNGYAVPSAASLSAAFTIILPLSGGLAAAQLMSIETEEGFDDLRRSYPEARFQLPLLRSVAAMAFIALSVILGIIGFGWVWSLVNFDFLSTLLPALPPAIFLSGLSLLVNGISRSYWAAAGVTMGWWFLEMQTRGRLISALFLFNTVWPQPGIQPELNQQLLFAVGAAFFLINVLVYVFKGEWTLRRHALGKR